MHSQSGMCSFLIEVKKMKQVVIFLLLVLLVSCERKSKYCVISFYCPPEMTEEECAKDYQKELDECNKRKQ